MVTKLEMASIEESSTKSNNSYLKRIKKFRPTKVTVEYYGADQGSTTSAEIPASPESQFHDAPRDDCPDDVYRSQPSTTPRRVLRTTPMAAEPTSHSMRSTMAVKCPSPSSNSGRSSVAVKSKGDEKPKKAREEKSTKARRSPWSTSSSKSKKNTPKSATNSKTRTPKMVNSSGSKQRNIFGMKKNRTPTSPTSPAKVQRLLSVSDDEARITANYTIDSLYASQPNYRPPAYTKSHSRARSYSQGSAVTDSERKVDAENREQLSPSALSNSTESCFTRQDRYSMDDGSIPNQHQRSPVHYSMYNNETASSGMGKQGGSSAMFTFDTRDTRDTMDTRDFSGTDTYDDTYVDETFTEDDGSKRNILNYKRSLSENMSSFDGSVVIKQQVAWGCIGLSAVQFAVLTTQVLLCGVAALSINPTLGPYPDAFSEWGGKNTYLLVAKEQYFRLITPIFLHVGYLHLLVNVFFQLETCAYLEREWGFFQWISIYLISGFGSCLAASTIDPNVIGVCSSGALMGLFGSRIAQAILWTAYETGEEQAGQGSVIFERLGGTVCSAAVVFFLTFLTYIDWSGHLGGLFAGFFVGLIVFSEAIKDRKHRSMMKLIGLFGMVIGGIVLGTILFYYAEADEELADACTYFRNLYSEGYSCECQAFD